MKKLALFTALLLLAPSAWADNCTTISQNGITWSFSASRECGQFLNGDWWVVGPVTVDNQSPAWDGNMNGAMIDPPIGSSDTGLDGRVGSYYMTYDAGLRTTFPTTITLSGATPKSLVSVIGYSAWPHGDGKSFIDNAAVLTVVNSAPSAASFRPAFVAGAKTFYDNASVNYTLVPSYTPPGSPSVPNMLPYMKMPWLNHASKVFGEENLAPISNSIGGASYPPYALITLTQTMLAMTMNTANRITYINRVIQHGIDQYAISTGVDIQWTPLGGYGMGHLMPILFAGAMLNDNSMLGVAQYTTTYPTGYRFSELGYTYFNDNDVVMFGSDTCDSGETYRPTCTSNCMCRDPNGVLFPEQIPPSYGDYRYLVSTAFTPEALIMHILESTLGLRTKFRHAAFFDYIDYWVANPLDATGEPPPNAYTQDVYQYGGTGDGFNTYMWTTYRGEIVDSTPSAFSFTNATNVAFSTQYTTDNVTVAGIDNTTTLTLTGVGCTYSINGAAFATADDNVALNDNVALRGTSSASYSTTYPSCTLTIGGVSNTWTVRTMDAVSDAAAPRMRAGSMSGGWR